VEPRFVDANGLKFAYLEWGTGPLLLLFHGFPDTARTWSVIGPRLAALGYRVVAPYMRGYAPTSLPPRDTTTEDLGRDVVALISALGAEKAVIVGHDWGSEAVAAAAGLAPERVEKLVLIAIPHRTQIPVSIAAALGGRHFITLRLPGALGRFCADDFAQVGVLCKRWSPTWSFTAEDLADVKRAFTEPGCANAALGYYRAAMLSTPAFMKARVTVPTLLVAGLHDPAVTVADFERSKRHHAAPVDLVAVPGGHFCHRESPEAVIAAVTKFLAHRTP
jgi:pimeloyl-ACP methyl ester carboxylesterase